MLLAGPVPFIEGLNAPIGQQSTGLRSTKSPPPGFPPLTPQDRAKFLKLFHGCGPANGLLNGKLHHLKQLYWLFILCLGDKVRDVLVRSKLPVEKLSQIWFVHFAGSHVLPAYHSKRDPGILPTRRNVVFWI